MSDTLVSLRRKIEGAGELETVVRTMKAVAASHISQYEKAVQSLEDYYNTVQMGLVAALQGTEGTTDQNPPKRTRKDQTIHAVVFGSDQGLVGQFNDLLTDFVSTSLAKLPGNKIVWAVGDRVNGRLGDAAMKTKGVFAVPNSVSAITPLVGDILIKCVVAKQKTAAEPVYLFHNRPKSGAVYEPVMQRLLPLDNAWFLELTKTHWPTKQLPEVIGKRTSTIKALISEYLFVSLFKACTESLASENASRLSAMQRAEKNINELLENLNQTFHHLRQSSIDEELFDVVSGFEALKKEVR